jgi:hypothetical protein
LVPEHAFAVDPGGFGAEHAKGRRLLRSSGPPRFRRGCSGRTRATAPARPRAAGGDGDRSARRATPAAGSAPGARRRLPEHRQDLIEGTPLATLALGPAGPEIRLQPCRCSSSAGSEDSSAAH